MLCSSELLLEDVSPCAESGTGFSKGAYCLGKVVWGKGWEELLTLLVAHKRAHPVKPLVVDAYGEGEALAAVSRVFCHPPVQRLWMGERQGWALRAAGFVCLVVWMAVRAVAEDVCLWAGAGMASSTVPLYLAAFGCFQ